MSYKESDGKTDRTMVFEDGAPSNTIFSYYCDNLSLSFFIFAFSSNVKSVSVFVVRYILSYIITSLCINIC